MELLDYEPTNLSRGSSLLDDTDTDVKVTDNPRDRGKVINIPSNAQLTFFRTPIPRSRTDEERRCNKRSTMHTNYSKNHELHDLIKKNQLPQNSMYFTLFPFIYYYLYLLPIHCHLLTFIGSICVPSTFCRMLV